MKLQVIKTYQTTSDSCTLVFDQSFEHLPGQYGVFVFNIDGESLVRNYSFNTSPYTDKNSSITIRSVPGGKVSNHIINNPTDLKIELEAISGSFISQPEPTDNTHRIFFAAGSGITPVLSIIKSILHTEDKSQISLIYSNRSERTIIFKSELEKLTNQYSNRFKIVHVLTDTLQPNDNPPEGFFFGKLSKLITKKLVKNISGDDLSKIKFFLCGPVGFMNVVEESLTGLSIDSGSIIKEIFFDSTPNENALNPDELIDRKVLFRLQHIEKTISVKKGSSLLEAGLQNNLNLLYSCQEGQCGLCRAELLTGDVLLRKNYILTENELNKKQILLCQGFPNSDDVVVRPINLKIM